MKAFPRADGRFDSSIPDEQGMDLRDYFAAMAVQGILSRRDVHGTAIEYAEIAYEQADAMMEARKQ